DRLRATVTGASHSGRLAVLGKMSAYLAHEIRNPLSAVKMNLQRLERWRRAEGLSERYAETIEISLREVDRLSATVSNILQLSPNRPQPREAVSIHELITEVGRLLDRDFARRGVALRWDLSAKADRVLGVPGQLKGVIINLMLNALDAQPRGGRLLICSALVSGTTEAPGPLLELRFRDHGSGVPPEIRDRIFEPFFTTKERGSGIGLALASQTVADHGGTMFLDASSRVEEGAEFVIRLPLAAVVHAAASGEVEPQVAPWLQQ
ncbi:MAG TPA: ATP-binding protein, partial [Longimicrobiales bacterium]|nr:ATP-binding protein [Longimicrobiales bacterium]